jgi:L-asparaginase
MSEAVLTRSVPKVAVISLGGTISSAAAGPGDQAVSSGVVPKLGADKLVEALRYDPEQVRIEPITHRQVASSSLTLPDVFGLVGVIERCVADGADGVVVTQGTDTMEEAAFVADLCYSGDAPVVFTGAMRDSTQLGADGAANLAGAVATALSPQARSAGVLLVMNDTIHSARWAAKRHTSNVAAFDSAPVGPLGWIIEGRAEIVLRPARRSTVGVPAPDRPLRAVAIAPVGLGEDGRILEVLPQLGFCGVVLQSFGGGHVPDQMMPAVRDLAGQVPVVLASRVRSGSTLSHTYGFPGSELDLAEAGVIPAGHLDPYKSRLLLTVLLTNGVTTGLREEFRNLAEPG